MMQKITHFIWFVVLAVAGFFGAEELYAQTHKDDVAQKSVGLAENTLSKDPTVWDKTKDVASDVWNGTKEVTSDVWDGTKKVSSDVWAGTKEVGSDIKDGISGDDAAKEGCTEN